MNNHNYWFLWVALFLLAASLRLPWPIWDGGIAAHPDERFILNVAQAVPLGGSPCADDFSYGHLPLALVQALVAVAPEADPLFAARLLSGLVGVLLVAIAGAWGKALGGERVGLLAGAVIALAPFPIQEAHFYTVDPLGSVLASAAVLAATRRRWVAAGALAGLSVACKASLVWVAIPVLFAAATLNPVPTLNGTLRERISKRGLGALIDTRRFLLIGGAALGAFACVSPWALLQPVACWRGPWIQAGMAGGYYDFPYTRQYAGTLPYLYPLGQLALWGLGPVAALLGLIGLLRALVHWRTCPPAMRVALVWTGTYFLEMSALYVKFPRYLLPLYPLWAGWAALLCLQRRGGGSRPARWGTACGLALIVGTALVGAAQLSVYLQPHPWVTASRWLYATLLPGESVAVEAWDHPLPVPLPEGESGAYEGFTLPIFDEESPEKQAALAEAAREADVIVLASSRGYGALARQPERYAETLAWYREILEEREVIAFGRCPRLGPVALADDSLADAGLPGVLPLTARCEAPYVLRLPHLDESFRVYDAPTVLLLLKR